MFYRLFYFYIMSHSFQCCHHVAHRWHQHAPTPLDRRGDVCCSTVTQHLRRSVFHNGCTAPVELVTNVTVSDSSNGCW